MKKILSIMVAFCCATSLFAQVQSDIRTATLIHGDQTRLFYGAGAFSEANKEAKDNDVIVLSPGKFNNVTITKSLTVYGAGFETDTISGAAPTSMDQIYISSREDYDEYGNKIQVYPEVHLEGIFSKFVGFSGPAAVLENLLIRKCKIEKQIQAWPTSKHCKLSQCVITFVNSGNYSISNHQDQLIFENCWIQYSVGGKLDSSILYDHCLIQHPHSGYAHYTNCILLGQLSENCTANNCIFSSSGMGSNVTGEGNWTGIGIDGIFVDATQGANYTATNDFTLRYPAKYVGTDGTEVGINGGNAPFDRISPIPRILSSDIDISTSNDGKLNVSIEVQAQTKE